MDTAYTIIVMLIAWLGHAFSWTIALNIIYSYPIHRKTLRAIRLTTSVVVFAFPISILCQTHLWPYYYVCLIVSIVIMPCLTTYRHLRRRPSQVLSETTSVHDIAKQLGYCPLGYGKHWRMARWPFNEIFEVEFVERTLQLDRLPPAWNGLSILHLSDLHFHGTPEREFFQSVIDLINERPIPDLVCITGDLVDTVWHQRWIKPLLSQLKWREGGLAILGNHDQWCAPDGIRRQLRRAGYTVLGNHCVELTVRGEKFIAIGHEGPWFAPPISPRSLTVGAQPGASHVVTDCSPPVIDRGLNMFRLLLSHTPDNIGWARQNNIDLMLSGHVHGGQVRVPILGSVFVPSRYSRKYDQGVFYESPTLLSVNRGLSGREPYRFHCRPEVTWLTLHS